MSETLTFTSEQTTQPSVEVIEGLAQSALQGAISTAERGDFTLSKETEAELRTVFNLDPLEELPLSAHGLSCATGSFHGEMRSHGYLLPPYRAAAE